MGAKEYFRIRDKGRRQKRERLGFTIGSRAARWRSTSNFNGTLYLGIACVCGLAMAGSPDKASRFDFIVVVILLWIASGYFKDARTGPPVKEGAPPWARERDGDACVDAWEAEQQQKDRDE